MHAAGRWSWPGVAALPSLPGEGKLPSRAGEGTQLSHEGLELVRPKPGWSYGEKRLFQAGNGKESTGKRCSCCCVVRHRALRAREAEGSLPVSALAAALAASPCVAEKVVGAWSSMHFWELFDNTQTAPFAP